MPTDFIFPLVGPWLMRVALAFMLVLVVTAPLAAAGPAGPILGKHICPGAVPPIQSRPCGHLVTDDVLALVESGAPLLA